jgi:hypothetical protein
MGGDVRNPREQLIDEGDVSRKSGDGRYARHAANRQKGKRQDQ